MRLHRLDVTAFGPFAGEESVDFDALAEGGLFLLHGPTGAGKTSVLDAVCFALYGQVLGTRRTTTRLRSDHADPSVPPQPHTASRIHRPERNRSMVDLR